MGNAVSSNLPEDWATVDMVNRFTFCPRLFHLMYVEGRWEENHFPWEQRFDQLHTHPEFGYRCSWRTILRIQARLLVRLLRGDIPHLPWPVVR